MILFSIHLLFFLAEENIWTPEVVTLDDVKRELEELLEKKRITNWKMEVCTRKYAFELPDIPKETQYIKLNYSFRGKMIIDLRQRQRKTELLSFSRLQISRGYSWFYI